MKNLIILLLFVSGAAWGQTSKQSISRTLGYPLDISPITIIDSNCINCALTVKNPKHGDIKILEMPIRTPVCVAVSDKGLLRLVEAFHVVTSQKYSSGGWQQLEGGGRVLVAEGYGETRGWHTHKFHYEDKEGSVLPEVFELKRL